ncbi:MAG: nicotinate-nucleotide adenylyltransferase [Geminicoccaceae bacterium]|nr:nicotinate-nucleotide adenylyltransferase [Geminicoccaceae bacterium]
MTLLPLIDLRARPLLHRPCARFRPPPVRGRAIGLLGGSFNPAHAGHRHLSIEALARLALDEVWWLVSPQNPLKPRAGMAPLEARVATARRVADHPRIRVDAIEQRLGTRYTVDTLARLKACRNESFIWLIGADNLLQLPSWRRWRTIFATTKIAVFARDPYSHGALAGKAARVFGDARVAEQQADRLRDMPPPAWTFIHLRPHPASGTALRAAGVTAVSLDASASHPENQPYPPTRSRP